MIKIKANENRARTLELGSSWSEDWHMVFNFTSAHAWVIIDSTISKRPMPMNRKSNSVQALRASFAKVCKKLVYASICLCRTEIFSSINSSCLSGSEEQVTLSEADQFVWAFEYRSATLNRSSDGNPITEVAEYTSMYLFTYKIRWISQIRNHKLMEDPPN
jgi:hypothetical protein